MGGVRTRASTEARTTRRVRCFTHARTYVRIQHVRYYYFPRDGENQRMAWCWCGGVGVHGLRSQGGVTATAPGGTHVPYRRGRRTRGERGTVSAPPAGEWTRAPAPCSKRSVLPSTLRPSSRRRPSLLRRHALAPSFLRVPTCMHLLIKRLSTYPC